MKCTQGYEYVNCDLCGEDNTELVLVGKDLYNNIPGEFQVVKCLNCGFVFTNPRPYGEELAKYYPDNAGYYIPKQTQATSFKQHDETNSTYDNIKDFFKYTPYFRGIFRAAKIIIFPRYLLLRRKQLMNGIPEVVNGRLLDIGCSYGTFLKEMKDQGWDVIGIEPNKKAADFGVHQLGLEIINSNVEEAVFTEKFDVITMRMVLEHLPKPSGVLNKVNQILRDNGTLIIIVPDFSGTESRLFKEFCYTLQVPTHLNHFTPETVKKYLRQHGFKVDKIIHHNFDRDFTASATYLKNAGVNSWMAPVLHNRFFRKTVLRIIVNIISWLGKTSRMTIWARKIG